MRTQERAVRTQERAVTDLFSSVLEATEVAFGDEGRLARFLRSRSDALGVWLALEPGEARPSPRAIRARLAQDIARIDRILSRQVDAILHAVPFQRLEASWRGVQWLVEKVAPGSKVEVRLLDISWVELAKDLDRAIEFDQSQAFSKIYTSEFGMPGGTPYGVLLGDYFVSHRPRPDQPVDDVRTLRAMSSVAAASFAPFIVGAHPNLIGVDSFAELGRPIDLARIFSSAEYVGWNSLRATEDSRFLGVVLPRVLARLPHRADAGRRDGFVYREHVDEPSGNDYLWGNPCYAFGSVAIRAFEQSGWLGDIGGVQVGVDGGGLVTDLPVHHFETDRPGTVWKPSTDLVVTDRAERAYGELGLIALCTCRDTPHAAIYSVPSLQVPKIHDRAEATRNARLSAMMPYILCVSRFAHYLKVICRDLEGSYTNASELEKYLKTWLAKYTIAGTDIPKELQAKHPLRASQVAIDEVPGKPGVYRSVIHLQPHYQLDQMTSAMRLVTEMMTR